MNFSDTAKRHLQHLTPNVDLRVCPDQYVGEVMALEGAKKIGVRKPATEREPGQRCVLLILESPHIREFKGDHPGPAKGSTGISIATRLQKVPGLDSVSNFGLLLVNAIQYQCSLGLPTIVARDDVFLEMWESGGRDNFIARLRELFHLNDTVVNACTKGKATKSSDQLRVRVQQAIETALPGTPILRRTHPSSWHSPKNLAHEWSHAV